MASTPTTPLMSVEWQEFQDFISGETDRAITAFEDALESYLGTFTSIGDYPAGTPLNIQRLRVLNEGIAGVTADIAAFQQVINEYQTKKDLNGDGHIFGHDFVWEIPQPLLAGVTTAALRATPSIEVVPGEPPADFIYNG